jgi:hypothetical protein
LQGIAGDFRIWGRVALFKPVGKVARGNTCMLKDPWRPFPKSTTTQSPTSIPVPTTANLLPLLLLVELKTALTFSNSQTSLAKV